MGKAANIIALLKLLKELWPYVKDLLELFHSLQPAEQEAVMAELSATAEQVVQSLKAE